MAESGSTDDVPKTWHLCWQAAVGREIFSDVGLYQRVRLRLIDAHRSNGRTLLDYLLLPAEIHVIASVMPGDSPGLIARAIGNVVARWVRESQPVRSPVFAGPFTAVRVDNADELRNEVRMLAWRPVLLGLCATPIHYPNSALRTVLGQRPAQGFDARPILRLFGPTIPEARKGMRRWLAKRPDERDVRQWQLMSRLTLATGAAGPRSLVSRAARQASTARLVAAGGEDGVDGALGLLELWVRVRLGLTRQPALNERSSIGARVRALVACLAVDNRLCSAASVARHFGKAKATLSEQMFECRRRPADRPILERSIDTIVDEALSLTSNASPR